MGARPSPEGLPIVALPCSSPPVSPSVATVRVLLDVSAVPDRPVGAGVYTVALAEGLQRADAIDLVLLARKGDADRWSGLAPGADVHAVVPSRRPSRLAW